MITGKRILIIIQILLLLILIKIQINPITQLKIIIQHKIIIALSPLTRQ